MTDASSRHSSDNSQAVAAARESTAFFSAGTQGRAMAVYVDECRVPWRGDKWSHLIADTTEELHAFAGLLGLDRRRFHHNPTRPWKDHYDVPEAKRRQAIRLGAKPISSEEAARMLRARRLALRERPPSLQSSAPSRAGPGGGDRRS